MGLAWFQDSLSETLVKTKYECNFFPAQQQQHLLENECKFARQASPNWGKWIRSGSITSFVNNLFEGLLKKYERFKELPRIDFLENAAGMQKFSKRMLIGARPKLVNTKLLIDSSFSKSIPW
jgi:hypothetical protein